MDDLAGLRGRRVLVTGATGFIGGALCRRLVRAGARVHGTSRRAVAPPEGVIHHRCNLVSKGDLRSVLRQVQPDVVYHLAGHVSGSRALDVVLPSLHGNLVTSVNVLMACVESGGCPVILAGSLEEPDLDEPVPVSPYAAAKGATTSYARMFDTLYGLPVSIARIFMAYGPGQPPQQVVPYVIRCLLSGEAPLLSSGERSVDWIFIEDVVEGLARVGLESTGRREVVELGSGQLVSVRRVAERIREKIGSSVVPRFGALPDRPRERLRQADVEATARRLRWRPRISLDEGLDRTIEWTRQSLAGEGA